MTSLLLVLCAAHAFVQPPPTRQATQLQAIRNWWSGASSDRDWRAALREACAGVAAVLGEADDDAAVLALCFASRGHACLLYTSPSPRDATLSRMPSSA